MEEAALCSAANIEGFGADTKVLLACDVSGSMCRGISPRSKVENYDIGLMLAMMLKCHCYISMALCFEWRTMESSFIQMNGWILVRSIQ